MCSFCTDSVFLYWQQCSSKGNNNFSRVQCTNLFCVVLCKSFPRRFRTVCIFTSVFGIVGLANGIFSGPSHGDQNDGQLTAINYCKHLSVNWSVVNSFSLPSYRLVPARLPNPPIKVQQTSQKGTRAQFTLACDL